MQQNKKIVLSFYTFTGTLKFYAAGAGELNNGEQTTDVNKAAKFETKKQAEKVNSTLEAYYHAHTIIETAPGYWLI